MGKYTIPKTAKRPPLKPPEEQNIVLLRKVWLAHRSVWIKQSQGFYKTRMEAWQAGVDGDVIRIYSKNFMLQEELMVEK